jgi:hypothetical protein
MTTPPPATFNGKPIPRADWGLFGTFGQASEIAALVIAAVEAIPGVQILSPIAVVENSVADDFLLTTPVHSPPEPTDVGDWAITGNFAVGQIPEAAVYRIDDWLGLLSDREIAPDPGSGDTNYTQVGHGANTMDVPVPGKIALNLLTAEGLAECYWVPA